MISACYGGGEETLGYADHKIRNDGVGGSIPSCGTIKINYLTASTTEIEHVFGLRVTS